MEPRILVGPRSSTAQQGRAAERYSIFSPLLMPYPMMIEDFDLLWLAFGLVFCTGAYLSIFHSLRGGTPLKDLEIEELGNWVIGFHCFSIQWSPLAVASIAGRIVRRTAGQVGQQAQR